MAKPVYDTTLARIAGNVLAGLLSGKIADMAALPGRVDERNRLAIESVHLARLIVAEVIRTEPAAPAEHIEKRG